MNCNIHHEKEASFRCFECGDFICKECAVDMDGKIVCKGCLENHLSSTSSSQKKGNGGTIENNYIKSYNGFLALIFSLIPGAGQMYLGLMNRGLQLMVLFTLPIALANIFYFDGWLAIFNVIIWFYSFFDCLHIRRTISKGEDIKDEPIYDVSLLDVKQLNYKHIGIGLIAVGGIVILNNGFSELSRLIDNYLSYGDHFYRFYRFMRHSSFPVLLIIIGIYLLKKSKVEKEV
ncbi:B-box zinc finger protein [Wukongibacter sp. M2B1]|uniref:B-box zinc finger protein n=1 Tax=Wukongibacter sp. M2B1 TaxID=3088895 RepID=UPI003D79F872